MWILGDTVYIYIWFFCITDMKSNTNKQFQGYVVHCKGTAFRVE